MNFKFNYSPKIHPFPQKKGPVMIHDQCFLCHCCGYRFATWPYMALVLRDDLNRDLSRKVYDGMFGYCVVLVWYNFNGMFIVIQWDTNGIYHNSI